MLLPEPPPLQEEDAGGADAEHRQLERADSSLQVVGGTVRDRRTHHGPAPQHLRRLNDGAVMVPPVLLHLGTGQVRSQNVGELANRPVDLLGGDDQRRSEAQRRALGVLN